MFDRLKFSASALVGLALGVCLALPLFWIGVKSGVGALRASARAAFGAVEARQQNMADEALRLEVHFKDSGVRLPSSRDFAKVELLRSRLAGSGDFEDKIEISQDLERALVNVETLFSQTMGSNPKASRSAYCREFGLNWHPMMRYLVDEEYHFSNAVRAYDNVLESPPVPFIVGHRSFGSLVGALALEIRLHLSLYLSQALEWVKFAPRWIWARLRGAAVMPETPQALALQAPPSDALYTPLPVPYYIAQAPVPEEDYPELQYDRDAPAMADVEVGQQKAVLENGSVTPYAAPVPTIQRTATY